MPSSFFKRMLTLVAGCAQPVRQMTFFNSTAGNALNKVSRPLSNQMLFSVFFWANKYKVTKAVILRVSVYMMYVHTLWCIGNNAMFIRPFVWLSDFYLYVRKTLAGHMQAGATYGKFYPHLIKYMLAGRKDFGRESFISTGRATRRIGVGFAVRTLPTYNWGTAKRARFGDKFFHARSVYQAT